MERMVSIVGPNSTNVFGDADLEKSGHLTLQAEEYGRMQI